MVVIVVLIEVHCTLKDQVDLNMTKDVVSEEYVLHAQMFLRLFLKWEQSHILYALRFSFSDYLIAGGITLWLNKGIFLQAVDNVAKV